jgi:integrase
MARGSIKKRGSTWRARYYDENGAERQKSFATRGEATRFLTTQLAALQRGEWVDPSAGSARFATFAATWLSQQHWRRNTTALIEGHVRLHLNPVLGELPLGRVRRSHVVEVIRRASVDGGLSAGVVRAVVTTLKRILDAAVADRLITSNVARDRTIPLPRVEKSPYTPLSDQHVAAIVDSIEPPWRALVITMAASGLRPSEAMGLTLDRCVGLAELLGDGTVVELAQPRRASGLVLRVDRQTDGRGLGFAPPKSASSSRDVSVPPVIGEVLAAHVRQFGLGPDQLLFRSSTGRMLSRARASEIWGRATRGLDVPEGCSWHSLRHHHASTLLGQGVNIATVSQRLGHSSPTITLAHYAWSLPTDEQRVLAASEAIARRLA